MSHSRLITVYYDTLFSRALSHWILLTNERAEAPDQLLRDEIRHHLTETRTTHLHQTQKRFTESKRNRTVRSTCTRRTPVPSLRSHIMVDGPCKVRFRSVYQIGVLIINHFIHFIPHIFTESKSLFYIIVWKWTTKNVICLFMIWLDKQRCETKKENHTIKEKKTLSF